MEFPDPCCSESFQPSHDSAKCRRDHEVSISLLALTRSLLQQKQKKILENEKLKSLLITSEENIRISNNSQIQFTKKPSQVKGVALSEYFSKLVLPEDLFTITTKEDLSIAFLIQIEFLPFSIFCHKCQKDMPIVYFGYCGYIYYCFSCLAYNKVRTMTCLQHSPFSLEKAILFVYLWILGIRNREISSLLEISHGYISRVARRVRQIVGEEAKNNLPRFSGVVEIAEFDFVKRKIEIGKSKSQKKWILLIVERKTKVSYVEYLSERSKEVILPIIKKLCLPGTVIITKAWAGYGRLEDFGYCHYTYDGKKGFIDPENRYIHQCTVKNAFNWLKYHIKTKNRLGNHLQEYLLEWIWRKMNIAQYKLDLNSVPQVTKIFLLLKTIPRIS